jgi:hypothetical protein
MGSKGGDVVRHLMGEAAAASKQAEEAETREAELVAQIKDYQFHTAHRYRR